MFRAVAPRIGTAIGMVAVLVSETLQAGTDDVSHAEVMAEVNFQGMCPQPAADKPLQAPRSQTGTCLGTNMLQTQGKARHTIFRLNRFASMIKQGLCLCGKSKMDMGGGFGVRSILLPASLLLLALPSLLLFAVAVAVAVVTVAVAP